MNNERIKDLIKQYQNNLIPFSELANELADYIYNFPKITFKQNEDVCSDFFVYFYKRLPNILMKYKIMDYKFTTWFLVVLRNHFYNWKRSINKINEIPIEHSELCQLLISDAFDCDENSFLTLDNNNIKNIPKLINELPEKVKIVVKLHYFDFFDENDFFTISSLFNKDLRQLILDYKYVLSSVVNNSYKLHQLEDKTRISYSKLIENEIPINVLCEDNNAIIDNKRKQKLIEQYKNNIAQLKKSYRSIDNKSIGFLLGISNNAVNNLLFRGRQILKMKIKELIS